MADMQQKKKKKKTAGDALVHTAQVSINVIKANPVRLCKQQRNLSWTDLQEFARRQQHSRTKKKVRRGRQVSYFTDGTRMPALLPGSWHQAWAPSAHSNCLHFQIYDCMINEVFILPSATLQSVFPINKEPGMTQGDWFLISIWCHHAEYLPLMTANWNNPELRKALKMSLPLGDVWTLPKSNGDIKYVNAETHRCIKAIK